MDALEEDACIVVTAPAFTAECPNATRPSVRDVRPARGRAITRRSGSNWRTRASDQRGSRNAGGRVDQTDAPDP